ncbi:polysaccharide deacetylase family protein [Bacillus infantis]|uniref:polysaccharide deacetylase family protein n=1 Tax=Bacillus infantis TaxID=324767 RepID=UPI00398227DB
MKAAKGAVAFGFLVLLTLMISGFSFVVDEYDILAVEHQGLYPADQSFHLDACTKESTIKKPRKEAAAKVPVLSYHHIVSREDLSESHYIKGKLNPMVVLKEDFEKQMAYLKEKGYTSLTLSELYDFLARKKDVPAKSVVITFDDGYKDNYVEAYPILKKYNFTAVSFIITGYVTSKLHPYVPEEIQYLSLHEIERGCDVFDYQSHTYNLHQREKNRFNQDASFLLTKEADQIEKDLRTSIRQLEGRKKAFAYPYGEYSPNTINSLINLGFRMAFTVEKKAAERGDRIYEIPRLPVVAETTMEEFIEYVKP